MEQMKARLAEIVASLTEMKNLETLTNDQIELVNTQTEEYNTIQAQIKTKESMDSVLNTAATATTRTAAPVANVKVGNDRRMENGNGGFKNIGEFFQGVKNASQGGELDQRLKAVHSEKSGAEGGFLIPSTIITEIQSSVESDESLLSRCRQFNTKGNRVSLMVNETAPWDGAGETVDAHWVGEGKKINESDASSLKEVDIKLEKIAAIVNVTEEMLDDSNLIESYIRGEVPAVITSKINNAIISGNGVKKPQGIYSGGFGFEVAKESGQTAGTIEFENVKKLYTHALPKAKKNGLFLYNVACEEQLIGMKLDPSSADSPSVYLPGNSIAGAPYGTLWGKAVMPMMGAMPALGSAGDMAFVDFSYYYAALKTQGLKSQMSIHAKWDEDLASFKFTFRVGGLCPFTKPQETEFGGYKLSGFTYLQARA
jgi:HK97 family phage major capsid protein